uniref:Uncharacterized protein n=1 Tax=Anguilla anguilla TaxID=7936 RepID=A0A0E9Q5Y7_ANGAN
MCMWGVHWGRLLIVHYFLCLPLRFILLFKKIMHQNCCKPVTQTSKSGTHAPQNTRTR